MVIIVNDAILYSWRLLKVDFKCSHCKKKKVIMMWHDGDLVNALVVVVLWYVSVSNEHMAHLTLYIVRLVTSLTV